MTVTAYCDESGRFRDTERQVSVAAVVVSGPPGRVPKDLRRTFRALWPFLGWPIHAAHVAKPAWCVAAWLAWLDRRDLAEVERSFKLRGLDLPTDVQSFEAASEALWRFLATTGDWTAWAELQAWGGARGFAPPSTPGFELARFAAAALRCNRGPLEPWIQSIREGKRGSLRRATKVFYAAVPSGERRTVRGFSERVLATLGALAAGLDATGDLTTERRIGEAARQPDRYLALAGGLAAELPAGAAVRFQGRWVRWRGEEVPLNDAIAQGVCGPGQRARVDDFPWRGDRHYPIEHVAADFLALRSLRWLREPVEAPDRWAAEVGLTELRLHRWPRPDLS